MYYFALYGLGTGVTTLVLAFIIFRFGNLKTALHRVIFTLNISLSIWSFGCAIVGLSGKNINGAIMGWKIAHIGAFVSAVFVLHIALLLASVQRKVILVFAYIVSIFLPLFAFANLLQTKLVCLYNSFYYIMANGITYPIFIILYILVGSYASFILYNAYRVSEGQKRIQFKYLLLALMVGYWGASAPHLLIVFNIKIFPFGNLLLGVFPLVTTYAILRHQLLEIEVIIKKTLVFAGLLASVFAMLVLPTLVIQEYIFRGAGVGGRILGLTLSGIIIILALRRIENFLINVTDKYLFQKKYDYKELLKTFTSEVLTVLDLNKLVRLTVDKLSDIIKITSCGMLLLNKEKNQYELAASMGIGNKNIVLGLENTLASFLNRTKSYLSVKHQAKDSRLPKKIIEDMNKLKLELAIPLVVHDEMIGILTLGKKKSDEDYTQDDMDILLPLARTLAIAISNAEMVKNITKLQQEAVRKERLVGVGTLAAGMAHEIKNPLTSIKTFIEYIDKKYQDPTFRQKFKSIVPKEIDKITNIINQLLDYSKTDRISLKRCSVHNMLDYVLDLYSSEFIKKNISIKKSYTSQSPDIICDENQIKQTFINIVLNSIEAMPNGGELTVETKDTDNTIDITIQDTGKGIPKENLKNLFDPFYTTKDKGTGLGLFIVHQIIENNKGSITIDSEINRGTIVRVRLRK